MQNEKFSRLRAWLKDNPFTRFLNKLRTGAVVALSLYLRTR